MTYQQALTIASQRLKDHDIFDESMPLMVERCQELGLNLYLIKDEPMDETFQQAYFKDVERLLSDEPLAHILGYTFFYGRRFEVNGDVLIPRDETEELVEHILYDIETYFSDPSLQVADIGTGCGNIGLTLKAEMPLLQVHLSDISDLALTVAQRNAQALALEVQFYQGNLGEPLLAENLLLDVLVCNPPYIQTHEEVQTSVLNYEPHVALFGGADGLDFYRQVLQQSHQLMKPQFMMAFEMGYQQRASLTTLIKEHYPEARVLCRKDMNQLDRMMFVYQGLSNT